MCSPRTKLTIYIEVYTGASANCIPIPLSVQEEVPKRKSTNDWEYGACYFSGAL